MAEFEPLRQKLIVPQGYVAQERITPLQTDFTRPLGISSNREYGNPAQASGETTLMQDSV